MYRYRSDIKIIDTFKLIKTCRDDPNFEIYIVIFLALWSSLDDDDEVYVPTYFAHLIAILF